jgi:hypothetical protein
VPFNPKHFVRNCQIDFGLLLSNLIWSRIQDKKKIQKIFGRSGDSENRNLEDFGTLAGVVVVPGVVVVTGVVVVIGVAAGQEVVVGDALTRVFFETLLRFSRLRA